MTEYTRMKKAITGLLRANFPNVESLDKPIMSMNDMVEFVINNEKKLKEVFKRKKVKQA